MRPAPWERVVRQELDAGLTLILNALSSHRSAAQLRPIEDSSTVCVSLKEAIAVAESTVTVETSVASPVPVANCDMKTPHCDKTGTSQRRCRSNGDSTTVDEISPLSAATTLSANVSCEDMSSIAVHQENATQLGKLSR